MGVVDRCRVELSSASVLVGALEGEYLIEEGILAWVALGEADECDCHAGRRWLATGIDGPFEVISGEFDLDLGRHSLPIEHLQFGLGEGEIGVDLIELNPDLVPPDLKRLDLGLDLTRGRRGGEDTGQHGEGEECQRKGGCGSSH